MRSLRRLALTAALPLLAAGACRPSAESGAGDGAATREPDLSGFRLSIVQSGGIAGMQTTATVDGATLGWRLTRGRMCAPGADCSAESESGTLPERDVRALEQLVARAWDGLIDDYGRTEGAADLYEYEIELHRGGRTRRVTADELTLPVEVRSIRDRLFQAIDSAQGR